MLMFTEKDKLKLLVIVNYTGNKLNYLEIHYVSESGF